MPKNKAKQDQRILIQFDEETYEKIRLLAFQSRESFAEIVRRCVKNSFDKVKKDLEKT